MEMEERGWIDHDDGCGGGGPCVRRGRKRESYCCSFGHGCNLFPAPCTYIIDGIALSPISSSCIQVGLHQNCTFQSYDHSKHHCFCLPVHSTAWSLSLTTIDSTPNYYRGKK
uniref:Uncharacterized protein n=1 Tax=Oryza barthii TaxID=65489 RepID=A0A0D3HI77_9ORYZ